MLKHVVYHLILTVIDSTLRTDLLSGFEWIKSVLSKRIDSRARHSSVFLYPTEA